MYLDLFLILIRFTCKELKTEGGSPGLVVIMEVPRVLKAVGSNPRTIPVYGMEIFHLYLL